VHRPATADRDRGHKLLEEVSEAFLRQGYALSEVPIVNVYVARERARRGDRDDAIPLMRAAVDDLFRDGRLLAAHTRISSDIFSELVRARIRLTSGPRTRPSPEISAHPVFDGLVNQIRAVSSQTSCPIAVPPSGAMLPIPRDVHSDLSHVVVHSCPSGTGRLQPRISSKGSGPVPKRAFVTVTTIHKVSFQRVPRIGAF
jgi:hypothetical protein